MKGLGPTLLLLLVVALGGAVAHTIRRASAGAGPERTLVVGTITLRYSGPEPLAVIVECQPKEGGSAAWAYAMLGDSGGRLTLPQPIPEGTSVIFRLAIRADIVEVTGQVVEPASLRGLSGAHARTPLSFRDPVAETTFKLGPEARAARLLAVYENRRVRIGEAPP
jgi:hypothetical protein